MESEDSIEEEEDNQTYKLILDKEKKYWQEYFIINYVYKPMCKHKNNTIGNGNTVLNPKKFICNNYKCSKKKYEKLFILKNIHS